MDKSELKYRHEYKYSISDLESTVLKERIKLIMPLDIHVCPKGNYHVSSLYFDDYYDSCLYQNENGINPKEKYRIRLYNHDRNRILLEYKRKENGKTLKVSCPITEEQVRLIIKGKKLLPNNDMAPLLKEFIHLQYSRELTPKVIVDYIRIPYTFHSGNVRVTFDSDLSSSSDVKHFLDGNYISRPIMPIGELLLEVKYDEFIPDHIYEVMQLNNLTQTAFSKYYLCRKQNINSEVCNV
jgi:hypothetical protein